MSMQMKYCSKCQQTKDIEEFHADKTKRDGKHSTCKACVLEYQRSRSSEKKCRHCLVVKPISEFYKRKSSPDKLQSWCKTCTNEYDAARKQKKEIQSPLPIIQEQIRKTDMIAIPTLYNGYPFRSRLEARFAVALDHIAIAYEYEIESYRFSDGTQYLPDFYFPDLNLWAEVKPTAFTVSEFKKCVMLADNTAIPCVLLSGSPNITAYFIYQNQYLSQAWDNYQKHIGFVNAYEIFNVTLEQWQAAVYASRAARFGVHE